MPRFGNRSRINLSQAKAELQDVMNAAIKRTDFSVIEGHRGKKKQNQYYDEGKSTVRFPDSKHNLMPSWAVDVVPWDQEKRKALHGNNPYELMQIGRMVQIIMEEAERLGVDIECGANWRNFPDGAHVQLRTEREIA